MSKISYVDLSRQALVDQICVWSGDALDPEPNMSSKIGEASNAPKEVLADELLKEDVQNTQAFFWVLGRQGSVS